jgi:2-C-methyl-D-erythritol 4-phosphate cytidylyltransferase / 2-C-methyl-D-erythritol 2,4-cyclodiphosphate synthase
MVSFSCLIVAAGQGLRAGPGEPKAWRALAGRPVLRWSVEALLAAGARQVVVVLAADRLDAAQEALGGLTGWRAVAGGATRTQSVAAGLAVLSGEANEAVLVHDAARPFVAAAHVEALLAALAAGADAAAPALPVTDTLKQQTGETLRTVSRDGLLRAQTPQAFRLGRLRSAYAERGGREATDDLALIERTGGRVALTAGDPMLMKLTYPEDFAMAERLASAARITRVGFGVDAHRWGPGDAVWLCGVRIPHNQALVGHSDADAGLHALTDALLGAIGEGDIGQHFPPVDPRWRGAASEAFLAHAAGLVTARGGRILNVDVTLVCEQPRVGPHRAAMRIRLAQILGLPESRVSVKATTTEGMGYTGRQEGLLAQAVAAVETPA